jgi:ArsR family transcriptional regulator
LATQLSSWRARASRCGRGATARARFQDIDNRLSLCYDAAVSTKPRPADCCTTPVIPLPLPAARQEQLVAGFKALADPTRLAIFLLIAVQDAPLCACDVVARFDLTQPTISHHLRVLREAGLIGVSRRGVWAYYAADPRGLALLRGALDELTPEPLAATG